MRIVTFNIATARYAPIAEIAAFLDGLNPDIVLVQEVDRFTVRSHGEDQHKQLAQMLGSAQEYFSATKGNALTGYYGTSIFMQGPYATVFSRINLSVKHDREKRFALQATLTPEASSESGVGLIANVHFSATPASAELQLAQLLEHYSSQESFLIGGDFNLPPEVLARVGFPDTDMTPTCGIPIRTRKLDRFIARINREFQVRTLASGHLSDHDAVLWEA